MELLHASESEDVQTKGSNFNYVIFEHIFGLNWASFKKVRKSKIEVFDSW